MPTHELTRTRSSPTWTGIECQLDTLRGGGKSYTRICDAAVIARFCAGRGTGSLEQALLKVETGVRPWRLCLSEVVLCLRSKHFLMRLWALPIFSDSGLWMHRDCRVISYT